MGTTQAPPRMNISAVLLSLLQAMAQTDRHNLPSDFFVDGKINFGVMGGSEYECKY